MGKMGQIACQSTRPSPPTPVPSISLVEPGPVATEFERKLLEQVSTAEFPGTDPDTLSYFRDLYLPASKELFRSVGQNPQDVAKVSVGGGLPRALRHDSGMRWGPSPQNSPLPGSQSSGLHPTGHCQGHWLGQTTLAPTDQHPLHSTDRTQSSGPLGQPVCTNLPSPALPLATPPQPWPSMSGMQLLPHPSVAPVSRASPNPPHP